MVYLYSDSYLVATCLPRKPIDFTDIWISIQPGRGMPLRMVHFFFSWNPTIVSRYLVESSRKMWKVSLNMLLFYMISHDFIWFYMWLCEMDEIVWYCGWKKSCHHLEWLKLYKHWDKPVINWCRILPPYVWSRSPFPSPVTQDENGRVFDRRHDAATWPGSRVVGPKPCWKFVGNVDNPRIKHAI